MDGQGDGECPTPAEGEHYRCMIRKQQGGGETLAVVWKAF